jgi:succinate dehydrogenase / fumarate reductase cytochrome b subunit
MTTMRPVRPSRLRRIGRWFDVRHRGPDAWAFALNRLTGIVLVLYLFVHLVVLSLLARGPDAWDDFLSLVRSPLALGLEALLVALLLFHGLNGLRVILVELGIGARARKTLFGVLMVVAAIAAVVSTTLMFGG